MEFLVRPAGVDDLAPVALETAHPKTTARALDESAGFVHDTVHRVHTGALAR